MDRLVPTIVMCVCKYIHAYVYIYTHAHIRCVHTYRHTLLIFAEPFKKELYIPKLFTPYYFSVHFLRTKIISSITTALVFKFRKFNIDIAL